MLLWSGHLDPWPLARTHCSLLPTCQMLLHLFSDANYNLLGFNATYSISLCPMGCSGHGICDNDGRCACFQDWGGEDCSMPDCSTYCHSHGTCSQVRAAVTTITSSFSPLPVFVFHSKAQWANFTPGSDLPTALILHPSFWGSATCAHQVNEIGLPCRALKRCVLVCVRSVVLYLLGSWKSSGIANSQVTNH